MRWLYYFQPPENRRALDMVNRRRKTGSFWFDVVLLLCIALVTMAALAYDG